MKWTVYILRSKKDNSFYIGVSNNIARRLKEHNKSLSQSTKSKIPWELIYTEVFDDRKYAYQKERKIKSQKKRKYIEKLIDSSDNSTRPLSP